MDIKNDLGAIISRFRQQNNYLSFSVKAVLIDMDGVLFDSMKNHTWSWYQALTEQNLSVQQNEFYAHEGRTGASTINLIFERELGRKATEGEIKKLYCRKTEYFNSLPESAPMPGAPQFIDTLQSMGIQPILVTGSGQKTLLDKLQLFYPDTFAPANMVTAFDVKYGKPHPEPYLMGLQKAGVQPYEAIVVENAPIGVEAGHKAGIFTVAVNTGPLNDSSLFDAGADILYPSMDSFASQFCQLYRNIETSNF